MRFKILDAPTDLRNAIFRRSERHNDVVINLSDCVAVSKALDRFCIRFLDATVSVWQMCADPTHQGRAHVKAHVFIVIDYVLDTSTARKNAACGIRAVALGSDSVVPIVERCGARLIFNFTRPRIFTRWLVEVSVNCEVKWLFCHNLTVV